MAQRQRSEAIASYLSAPNSCKHCGDDIQIQDGQKVGDARRKEFCNRSCAARFNNKGRKRIPKPKPARVLRDSKLEVSTKGELFHRAGSWQSARGSIQRHARSTYQRLHPMLCGVCGYSNHVEVAHRRAVAGFPDDAKVIDINSLDNLIALCPNHHWEYDHGVLTLSGNG